MPVTIPLVLVPGLLCTTRLYAPQIAALGDVAEIAVADATRQDSMPAIAASILADAPPFFALGGLSMGGYVSFEILRQAPERVVGLALLDTSARADTPEQVQRRKDFIALAQRGKFKGVTPQLLPMLVHKDRLEDLSITEVVYDMAEAVGRDAFIRQQKAILGRPDSRADLPGIRCPAAVIVGRDDLLTPPAIAEEMANGLPAAELTIVDACGHLSTLEQPDAVNAALRRWLGRLQ